MIQRPRRPPAQRWRQGAAQRTVAATVRSPGPCVLHGAASEQLSPAPSLPQTLANRACAALPPPPFPSPFPSPILNPRDGRNTNFIGKP